MHLLRYCSILFLLISFSFKGIAQKSPFFFVENKGQWSKNIFYRSDIPNGKLYLQKNALTYVFHDPKKVSEKHQKDNSASKSRSGYNSIEQNKIDMHALKVTFLNSSPDSKFVANQKRASYYNFFKGENSGAHAQAFDETILENVYKGINFRMYSERNQLKYDFIVKAGSSPEDIKLSYEGASGILLENGNIYIETSLNRIIEQKPYAYQVLGTDTTEVKCEFVLHENEVSFILPNGYDPSSELVIDPLLIFSTFSGSQADNWGFTATYGEHGTLYSGGNVFNSGFPETTGHYQESFAGVVDVAIIKFDSLGSNILWATYLGGSNAEVPHSLLMNNANELLIMGTTSSVDFPTSASAYDKTFNGGTAIIPVDGVFYSSGSDLFLSKLSGDGSTLLGSTYFGGTNNDGILLTFDALTKNYGDQFRGDLIVDKDDNIYVATSTLSTDIPANGYQTSLNGSNDAFIFKMNNDLSQLQWSTYLGGSGQDAAFSIKIDQTENVFVAGGTSSTNFPTTSGTIHPTKIGGVDGFVASISKNGALLTNSTYLGTTSYDQAYFLDIDKEENIYLLGQTKGLYPVSVGVYSNQNGGQFIHKMNKTFSKTIFSTVIGNSVNNIINPNFSPTAFLASECENIYLSGWSSTINSGDGYVGGSTSGLAVTNDAFQKTTNGSDFYLMVLSSDAKKLLYSTFFGGAEQFEHVDGGTSRFDKKGVVYHVVCAGCGGSSNFTTTPEAWSRSNNSSNCNMASFKFDLTTIDASFQISNDTLCTKPYIVNISKNINGAVNYFWDFGDGSTSTSANVTSHEFKNPGEYTITLTASNTESCGSKPVSFSLKVIIPTPTFTLGDNGKVCKGQSFQLSAGGGVSYSWFPVKGLDNPQSPSPIATPDTSTYYKVFIENQYKCVYIDSILVEVEKPLSINASFNFGNENICTRPYIVRINKQTTGVQNFFWDFGDGTTSTNSNVTSHEFMSPGIYAVTLKASSSNFCGEKTVEYSKTITITSSNFEINEGSKICEGESYQILANGALSYSWTPTQGLSDPNSSSPLATPQTTTLYKVKMIGENSCEHLDSILIEVVKDVEMNFTSSFTFNCFDPPVFEFTNQSKYYEGILWDFGDGTTSTEENPVHVFPTNNTYEVKLYGTNEKCNNVKTIAIPVYQMHIPNVFTPNGDGKNDFFEIKSQGPIKLLVVNRWGNRVFSNDEYKNDWNAEGLANGTYFYTVENKDGQQCKGWVQVLK